ncbi:MAG TPA: TolC family protein [Kofleriaceae bacterium]|nr:TolC family protein [Kofleriaceae bacterium]
MTVRISLVPWRSGLSALPVVAALAAAPALAQPARQAPKPPPKPAAAAPEVPDDMAAFEHDLDTLFGAGGLTSDQAAARAGNASATVRRKVAELEAAIAQADAAALARVPQVSAKASYTRLSHIDPVTLGFGGMNFEIKSFENAYLGEAQIVVPLSDYVLRFPKLIEAARLGADAARIDRRASEVNAGQDARLAYYEWVRARLQVLISKRQLLQVQKTLDQVRALAEVQRLSRADLLRVESQEAEAEQVVDQLENLAELREEQLRLLIGAPAGEPLAIGEDIRVDVAPPPAAQLDDLVGAARQRRLEFKALDTGIQAKESQRAAEKANLFPRLSAFGVADYANPNQRAFPQEDKFKFTWQAGAQLTWTLNDALVSRTTDRRIAAEANELRADRDNLERGTRIEVLAAQQAVAIALHALATSQKGLTAAEEGYRVRKELLNAERATAVELVDAETVLTRARIAALNARVDLRVARAQLEHALGNDTK